MTLYRLRMVEFVGEEEFPQGAGMTWDSVVIDIADGEQITHVMATYRRGSGFDSLRPATLVWLMSPESDGLRAERAN